MVKQNDLLIYAALGVGAYLLIKNLPSITNAVSKDIIVPISKDVSSSVMEGAQNLTGGLLQGAWYLSPPGMTYLNWQSLGESDQVQQTIQSIKDWWSGLW